MTTASRPQVHGIFDKATWTVTYVVHGGPGTACAIVDSVLDYDPKSGRIRTASADKLIACGCSARRGHHALNAKGNGARATSEFDRRSWSRLANEPFCRWSRRTAAYRLPICFARNFRSAFFAMTSAIAESPRGAISR